MIIVFFWIYIIIIFVIFMLYLYFMVKLLLKVSLVFFLVGGVGSGGIIVIGMLG